MDEVKYEEIKEHLYGLSLILDVFEEEDGVKPEMERSIAMQLAYLEYLIRRRYHLNSSVYVPAQDKVSRLYDERHNKDLFK